MTSRDFTDHEATDFADYTDAAFRRDGRMIREVNLPNPPRPPFEIPSEVSREVTRDSVPLDSGHPGEHSAESWRRSFNPHRTGSSSMCA
jgi:hypothetical protein